MRKIRLRYGQKDNGKFLGHLEVAKSIERALRRTGFEILLTEGFSPHLKIAFGPPLPVGYESETEICEFFVPPGTDLKNLLSSCLNNFPVTLRPIEIKEAGPGAGSLMAAVETAGYLVKLLLPEDLKEAFLDACEEFKQGNAVKYSFRKREFEVSFGRGVSSFELRGAEGEEFLAELVCSIRGESSIRPDVFLQSLTLPKNALNCIKINSVVRKELYFRRGSTQIKLMEL